MTKLNAEQLAEKLTSMINDIEVVIKNNVPVPMDEDGEVDCENGLLRDLQAEVANFRIALDGITPDALSKVHTIEVAVPEEYAVYFVNGDATIFDFYNNEADEKACYKLEEEMAAKGYIFSMEDGSCSQPRPRLFAGEMRPCIKLTCIKQAEYES